MSRNHSKVRTARITVDHGRVVRFVQDVPLPATDGATFHDLLRETQKQLGGKNINIYPADPTSIAQKVVEIKSRFIGIESAWKERVLKDGDTVMLVPSSEWPGDDNDNDSDSDSDDYKLICARPDKRPEKEHPLGQFGLLSTPLNIYHSYAELKLIQKPDIVAVAVQHTNNKKVHFVLPGAGAVQGQRLSRRNVLKSVQLSSGSLKDLLDSVKTEFGYDDEDTGIGLHLSSGIESENEVSVYGNVKDLEKTMVYDIGLSGPMLTASVCFRNVRPLNVIVKTLTGKAFEIEVDPFSAVESLKENIAWITEVPLDQQRLIFASHQLEDHRTLASYNIQSKCTLHLVLRLSGGMFHPSSGRKDFAKLAKKDKSPFKLNLLLPKGRCETIVISQYARTDEFKRAAAMKYYLAPNIPDKDKKPAAKILPKEEETKNGGKEQEVEDSGEFKFKEEEEENDDDDDEGEFEFEFETADSASVSRPRRTRNNRSATSAETKEKLIEAQEGKIRKIRTELLDLEIKKLRYELQQAEMEKERMLREDSEGSAPAVSPCQKRRKKN